MALGSTCLTDVLTEKKDSDPGNNSFACGYPRNVATAHQNNGLPCITSPGLGSEKKLQIKYYLMEEKKREGEFPKVTSR